MATRDSTAKSAGGRWTCGERRLLGGLAAFCVLAYGFWKLAALFTAPPAVVIPQVAAPTPNGFDTFINAGTFVTVQWRPWTIRPKSAAPDTSRPSWLITPPTPAQLATIRQAPAANSNALVLLRHGLGMQCLAPQYQEMAQPHPEWVNVRSLSRGVEAAAFVQAAHGEYEASLQTALDGLDMSSRLSHGGETLFDAYSVSGSEECRRPIWPLIDHLDASSSRKAALRIAAIDARSDSFAQVLTREKWQEIADLTQMESDSRWRISAIVNPHTTPQHRTDALISPAAVLRAYTRDMDLAIALVRKPYSPTVPPPSGVAQADCAADEYGCFLFNWDVWCKNAAANRLLSTSLALHAYKLDHGAYPATLQMLVPKYRPDIPADPFSSGPLQYRLQGSRYVLYSIGPDGRDDGGSPGIDSQNRAMPYEIDTTSRGDIVAGVNE